MPKSISFFMCYATVSYHCVFICSFISCFMECASVFFIFPVTVYPRMRSILYTTSNSCVHLRQDHHQSLIVWSQYQTVPHWTSACRVSVPSGCFCSWFVRFCHSCLMEMDISTVFVPFTLCSTMTFCSEFSEQLLRIVRINYLQYLIPLTWKLFH